MLDYHDLIYLVHFLIIGPLLIYIGYYKEQVDRKVYEALMGLGIIVTLYHFYKFCRVLYLKNKYKSI